MTSTSSAPNSRPSSRGGVPLVDTPHARPGSTPPIAVSNSDKPVECGKHLINLDMFTPPDRLIPGTGGSYQDWEYHPSRREASWARAAEVAEADGEVSKVDVFTQTGVVKGERELKRTGDIAIASPAPASGLDEYPVQHGNIATIILHDGEQVVSHMTWDCTPSDCFMEMRDSPKTRGHAQRVKDTN